MTLLEVKKLSKYFPVREGFLRKKVGFFKALHEASFTLQAGEVLGIVGESGSGKSTLTRCILRLIEPTSGEILYRGQDLLALSQKEMRAMRKKIQVVVQNPSLSLNPRKMVLEAIGEPLLVHDIVRNETELKDRIEHLLKQVGLDADLMHRFPHELSIGQQQRVSIARALSVEPELLLLDECVSALDVCVQAGILNLLQELLETMHMSYLFISHDLSVVEHLSDRILVMRRGEIVEQGSTEKILRDPEHEYTKMLLAAELTPRT